MSTQISVRTVTDSDIEPLIELWKLAGVFRVHNEPYRDIATARRRTHSTILVADAGDGLVASAMVGEDGHRGWVYYVSVRPELQGAGLGRRIMAAAEDWLRDRGIWKLQLLVRAGNDAVCDFYEQLGYQDTRTRCFQKVIE